MGATDAYDEVGSTRMLAIDHVVTTSKARYYGNDGNSCTKNVTYDVRRSD